MAHDAIKNINSLTLAFAKAVGNHQTDKNDNLVVSPYNALTCLAMVAKGADENTREEMAQTLFGISAKDLDGAVAELAGLNTDILQTNKGQVELRTANGVWANKELLTLNHKFSDELKKIFSAEISEETFSDPAVPGKINAWAGKNTNNLITKIIEELHSDDAAVLASALYFKGQWTHKFDKAETQSRAFTSDNGDTSVTPTMKKSYKSGHIRHQDGSDYEAVSLTYGQEDRQNGKTPTMRLVLIRPKDDNLHARDWLAQQVGDKAPAWLEAASFERAPGSVELPRLDIKQRHDLIPPLKEMGIRDAFKEGVADFSPMTEQGFKDLFIGKVTHDVVFKTDEEGSEAAAVTTVGMMRSMSVPRPEMPFDIKFDRSFVFALQDVKTGTVIFAGAVNKPNNDMKPGKKAPKSRVTGELFKDRGRFNPKTGT
jgi:serine protease inhibitor